MHLVFILYPTFFIPYTEGERTPVWLMRQAGRYMAAFREYVGVLLYIPTTLCSTPQQPPSPPTDIQIASHSVSAVKPQTLPLSCPCSHGEHSNQTV